MIFTRFIVPVFAAALLGACVSPEATSSRDSSSALESGLTTQADGASFPVATPPRFDGDNRTQEERDLETIGRKN